MLNMLLDQVKNAIFNSPSTPHGPGNDPDGLIGQITNLFGQHQQQYGGPQEGSINNPRPASEDPYGDPADQYPQQGGNARQGQPQGNPYQQFPGLRPASEDPYGDPADQR